MAGTLFVVATPIGNLEDITLRALRTLREVDLIAAEDTRRTAKLLAHYDIRRPLTSLHEHNEHRESGRLVERLMGGHSIALVSDAGTPGIADPGGLLVRAARAAGVPIIPIPGPSAITAALSVAGYVIDAFVFLGFPPSSGAARERWFESLAHDDRICIFFESPHRIERTLDEAWMRLGDRPIHVFGEMSKIHEKYGVSPIQTAASKSLGRGEFTVVIGPTETKLKTPDIDVKLLVDLFERLTSNGGIPAELAGALISAHFGIQSKDVLKLVKKAKILAKQQNTLVP
jgi:16S rRNA (cytidine1402-2'-O)-methyltransferase